MVMSFPLLLLAWIGIGAVAGAVEFDPPFGDEMVLQAGVPLSVHGRGEPGETVFLTFQGQEVTSRADDQGRWQGRLDPLDVQLLPSRMEAEGSRSGRAVLDGLLVGEVWLCAGQSNMAFPLHSAVAGRDAVEEAASLPGLRLLHFEQRFPGSSDAWTQDQVDSISPGAFYSDAGWQAAGIESAARFSAVGFFFGRYLGYELDRPVGLINVAVGGTPIEAWIPRDRVAADPDLAPLEHDFPFSELAHPFISSRAEAHLKCWVESGRSRPVPEHPFRPGFIYRAAIEPLRHLPIAGLLWYQGESNAHDAVQHEKLLRMLVFSMREAFDNRELPFLQVQVPGLNREEWPEFRESQSRVLDLPGVEMVTSLDLGHPTDVHPRNKHQVGERLARLALDTVYHELTPGRPPMLEAFSRDGKWIDVTFSSPGSGIRLEGRNAASAFHVAGTDKVFRQATAVEISGNDMRVACDEIEQPATVRYAWEADPDPVLRRIDDDMPVVPFRTDPWNPIRIACVGDSITSGHGISNRDELAYPAQLSRLAGPLFDVRNFGRSGTNVIKRIRRGTWDRAFIKNIEHARALAFEPHVVIVNLGINDVAEETFDAAEFVNDYLELIEAYRSLPTDPVILIWSPLAPLFEGQRFHGHRRINEVNRAIAAVAREARVATIDMFTPLRDHGEWFPDRLHPAAAGAGEIARQIHEALRLAGLPVSPAEGTGEFQENRK